MEIVPQLTIVAYILIKIKYIKNLIFLELVIYKYWSLECFPRSQIFIALVVYAVAADNEAVREKKHALIAGVPARKYTIYVN